MTWSQSCSLRRPADAVEFHVTARHRLLIAIGIASVASVAHADAPPDAGIDDAAPADAAPAPDATPQVDAAPAQTIAISGRVIDALGRPVRAASVTIQGDTAVVKTDRYGRYRIAQVAIGATIVVDKDGFETGLGVVSGALIDDVVLITVAQSQETIEIQGEPPPDSPGSTKIDRTEAERIPGTGGDLVRTLTALPGIVNTQLPTGFFGLVIRGSAPQDSKILID